MSVVDELTKRIARDDVAKQWQEIGVRNAGKDIGPVLPYKLKTRNEAGELEEEDVALALPSIARRAQARTRARKLAEEMKLDPSLNGEDADFVRTLERLDLLCHVIREYDPGLGDADQAFPAKFADAKDLTIAVGTEEKLAPVWSAFDAWKTMNDPRYGELSSEQLWAVIKDIAEKGDPAGPLAGLDGFDQSACIMRMALEASRSPNAPWSRPPSST